MSVYEGRRNRWYANVWDLGPSLTRAGHRGITCCRRGHKTPREAAQHIGEVVAQEVEQDWVVAISTPDTYAHDLVTSGRVTSEGAFL